jgi:sterol desaturase/sphingolipid hydroxylase (fatty acid hydroxylase superfamily)
MSLPSLSSIAELPGLVASFAGQKLVDLFVQPGAFSLASLLCTLCVAILFLGWRRQPGRKPLRVKVLLRALFPRRLRRSKSSGADIGYFVFSLFLVGILFGWAVLSSHIVSAATNDALAVAFGTRQPAGLSAAQTTCIMTVVLFVAYEFGYWIDHYLSHNVAFLWEFHKVHHTAEVLTPLTNFRVHPVDTIVFNNILALVMGSAGGIAGYLLGDPVQPFTISRDNNAIILLFFFLIGHLQHTHFWIAFTGVWGRILLSPAHHQIHHSTDPAHFNKNLGSFLAIWDWLFGTLHVPGKTRQKLDFGVEPKQATDHSVTQGLVAPLYRAASHIRPLSALRAVVARKRPVQAVSVHQLDAR